MSRPILALSTAVLLALLTTACVTDRSGDELLVLGPSSLADHLDEFNQPWADEGAAFSYAGSTTQVRAVEEGADADVLITANPDVAVTLVDAGLVPLPFVMNSLAIVTPVGNPAGVATLSDLGRDDLLVAICAVDVPCGAATDQLPVRITADTTEPNVRAVLTKVEEGIVDVGVVYASDAAVGRVEEPVALTNDENVWTAYVAFNVSGRPIAGDYLYALLTDGRDHLVELGIGFDAP